MEAIILRRNYPVPVTFADLRRAHAAFAAKRGGACSHLAFLTRGLPTIGGVDWHAALKSVTGATDDVYTVVYGREVHVARLHGPATKYSEPTCLPLGLMGDEAWALSGGILEIEEKADDQGYWERPHEVRLDLQERAP